MFIIIIITFNSEKKFLQFFTFLSNNSRNVNFSPIRKIIWQQTLYWDVVRLHFFSAENVWFSRVNSIKPMPIVMLNATLFMLGPSGFPLYRININSGWPIERWNPGSIVLQSLNGDINITIHNDKNSCSGVKLGSFSKSAFSNSRNNVKYVFLLLVNSNWCKYDWMSKKFTGLQE